jgi:hypothetical protein
MGVIVTGANAAFRQYTIDGVHTSGENKPDKAAIRALFATVEAEVDAATTDAAAAAVAATTPLVAAAQAAAEEAITASGNLPYEYSTTAVAEAGTVPAAVKFFRTAGNVNLYDNGGALFVEETGGGAPVDPIRPGRRRTNTATREWRLAEKVVGPQMFGSTVFGSGSNDTTALDECLDYIAESGKRMVIPWTSELVRCAALTLPAARGLHIQGPGFSVGVANGAITAYEADQPHVFFIPAGASYPVIEDLYFYHANWAVGDRPVWSVIDDTTGSIFRHVRNQSSLSGFWARKGGYKRWFHVFSAGTTARSFAFGGAWNGVGTPQQLTQCKFWSLEDDAQIADPNDVSPGSVAFDFLAGSAYSEFFHPISAGRENCIRFYDNFAGGGDTRTTEEKLSARPDGLYFYDANMDWAGTNAVNILAGTRIEFLSGANLRALEGPAISIGGTGGLIGTVAFKKGAAYASLDYGMIIQGNADLIDVEDFNILGNSYPTNTGGTGIYVAAGAGKLRITDGRIGGIPSGLTEYGVANSQDYGIRRETGATYQIEIDGTDLGSNDVAPFSGFTDGSGYLRSDVKLQNVITPGAADHASGFFTVTLSGSSTVTAAHTLAAKPRAFDMWMSDGNYVARGNSSDGTNITGIVRDAAGAAVTTGTHTIMWEAWT